MPKLYTKKGDNKQTSLFDAKNLSKSDPIFEALGSLDELSVHIGLLASYKVMNNVNLRVIQRKLLDIGSNISTVEYLKKTTFITDIDVKTVESWIDKCEEINTPLRQFILAGVELPDSQCHVCRVVCRRAEREIIRTNLDIDPFILQYMNRLSDYFFALSRVLSGCKEIVR